MLSKDESLNPIDVTVIGCKRIFELYNNAIMANSIFVSFLLLFQIVELIIDSASSTKTDKGVINQIASLVYEAKLV